MATENSMLDDKYGAGPVMYPLKVWIIILLVVVGMYVYYSKYYVTKINENMYYY